MASTFQYQLTRYSKSRAERQLSQIDHLQADSFKAASAILQERIRGANYDNQGWDYEIASLSALGYHGRTAQAIDLTFWPADPVKTEEQV